MQKSVDEKITPFPFFRHHYAIFHHPLQDNIPPLHRAAEI
jgi:hypothetical protein